MNPGHAFRYGKFYRFGAGSVLVVRPWGPRAGAWFLESAKRRWRAVVPDLSLSSIASALRDAGISGQATKHMAAAYRGLLDAIPAEALRIIQPFREPFWLPLQLLNRGGGPARDLFVSNRTLAFALSCRRYLAPELKSMRAARRLLSKKQRDIAAALGFPQGGAAVTLFRRIDPRGLSSRDLFFLRANLERRPELTRVLLHMRRIDRVPMCLVSRPRIVGWASSRLLSWLGSSEGPRVRRNVVREILELERLARGLGVDRRPLETPGAVRREHERLIDLINNEEFGRLLYGAQFPPPPIPGNGEVVPIVTPEALVAEGKAMRHCVATYWTRVVDGRSYIYSVRLGRERATLALSRFADYWEPGELSGVRNAPVSDELRCVVQRWFWRSYFYSDVPAIDFWNDSTREPEIWWNDYDEIVDFDVTQQGCSA